MKKIEYFLFALLVGVVGCTAVTSCDDDDDDYVQSNYERYQEAVNATVKSTQAASGNKKAILLVAFGSTWQQAFDAFDETVDAYEDAYPNYDVYLSFSSAICINRASAGTDNAEARNFYDPAHWLTGFASVEYSDIVVQSLQVIPGEEYSRVVSAVKDFANNSNGDLDDDYLSEVNLYIGYPLMADSVDDVENLAEVLDDYYGSYAENSVVAFMGHGNPDSYDIYGANIRYTQLETAMQKLSPNYFVGTVDMEDNWKNNVYERMQEAGITSGTVYCHPLMSIAGDHAHNDMAGDTDAPSSLDENDEEVSWKCFFSAAGYTCNDDTMILLGLLELPNVRQLWMDHTDDALDRGAEDLYHSMYSED